MKTAVRLKMEKLDRYVNGHKNDLQAEKRHYLSIQEWSDEEK